MLFFSPPAIWKVRRSECDKDHWERQESTVSSTDYNYTSVDITQYYAELILKVPYEDSDL